ncbi:MAG: hypothetical protein AMJ81_04975 [Phycisphaerae bacterium SM23_33]|nr:MAG: hypothetical protein AMJ81_04975 [Phycisphaerae bacterium SM23_33]
MRVELLLNVMWAVWLWLTVVAAGMWVLRRQAAALRRQLCRLGLAGVVIVMLGAGLLHAGRPGSGLWLRRVRAGAEGAAPAPRHLLTSRGEEAACPLPPAPGNAPDPADSRPAERRRLELPSRRKGRRPPGPTRMPPPRGNWTPGTPSPQPN